MRAVRTPQAGGDARLARMTDIAGYRRAFLPLAVTIPRHGGVAG
jgi:hypothetical protein